MEQLHTLDQLQELCNDPLILWAAQDMGSNVQVWTHGADDQPRRTPIPRGWDLGRSRAR